LTATATTFDAGLDQQINFILATQTIEEKANIQKKEVKIKKIRVLIGQNKN